MKAYIDRLAAHPDGVQFAYHEDLDYYEGRAFGLRGSAEDGTPSAVAAFERVGAPRTPGGARMVVARAHGFASWQALRRHVVRLPGSGEPFFRAYRAIEAHDPDGLRAVLERWPEVVRAEGTSGNDLLGMATATCDERTVGVLLDRGADPTRTVGRHCTRWGTRMPCTSSTPCSALAREATRSPAVTVASRWSLRCSGAIGTSPTGSSRAAAWSRATCALRRALAMRRSLMSSSARRRPALIAAFTVRTRASPPGDRQTIGLWGGCPAGGVLCPHSTASDEHGYLDGRPTSMQPSLQALLWRGLRLSAVVSCGHLSAAAVATRCRLGRPARLSA